MEYQAICNKTLTIINSFPHTNSGKPYLSTKSGKKVFFDVFIQKYGIHGGYTNYTQADVIRRIKLVEFFEYMLHTFPCSPLNNERHKIETIFYTMIIAKKYSTKNRWRYVVISFFPK